MSDKRQMIPLTGLFATMAAAGYLVVQLDAQAAASGDFRNAMNAEVQNAQGQIVLQGQFAAAAADDDDDDDVERKAALRPTPVDSDASGEAEVEFAKASATHQEIEFSVRNVAAGGALTFLIDGRPVGTATADRNGRAEIEVDVPIAASRQ